MAELYVNLDDESDILYISRGPAVASYATEDSSDPDIWYRFSDVDNARTGVTIFRAREIKGAEEIARIASEFLGLTKAQISERLTACMNRQSLE
jgi:uncharacterized protein YuzE